MPDEVAALPSRLYSVKEVAQRLAVSIKSVRRWITAGDLRAYRLGHQLKISAEDLRSFLDRRGAKALT